jgi:sodium-coupled neutral amino acid transporter 11
MILVIFVTFIIGEAEHIPINPTALSFNFSFSSLQALGGVSFVFVCHDLSFPVFEAYKGANRRKWRRVLFVTLLITTALFFMCGYAGYLMFFPNVNANILENFHPGSITANIARILVSLNIVISVPYSVFMPRLAITSVLALFLGIPLSELMEEVKEEEEKKISKEEEKKKKSPENVSLNINSEQEEPLLSPSQNKNFSSRPQPRFKKSTIISFITTILVMAGALTIAEFVQSLGVVYGVVGGVSASGMAFILPPIVYLKLEKGPLFSVRKIIHILVLMFGLLVLIGGTGTTIYSALV